MPKSPAVVFHRRLARVSRVGRRVLLVLLAALVVGVVFGLGRIRTDTLADRLTREALAQSRSLAQRPAHVAPATPGSFGDLARAPLEALGRLWAQATDAELCRAVRQGEALVSTLTPSCRAELARTRMPLEELLSSTHAESAGAPPGLGSLDDQALPLAHNGWPLLGYTARLATLDIWTELAARRPDVAAARCVDLLALARDLTWGTGVAGRSAAALVVDTAFRACAAAIDAAPVASSAELTRALTRVRDGRQPLRETMSQWGTSHLLEGFGRFLGRRLATLPEGARQRALQGGRHGELTVTQSVLLKDFWHVSQARVDGLVAAAELSPAPRIRRMAQLTHANPRSLNPFARVALPDLERFAEADARASAQLELLWRAAQVHESRARTGQWPAASALTPPLPPSQTLVPAAGDTVRLRDDAATRGELTLTLHTPL